MNIHIWDLSEKDISAAKIVLLEKQTKEHRERLRTLSPDPSQYKLRTEEITKKKQTRSPSP